MNSEFDTLRSQMAAKTVTFTDADYKQVVNSFGIERDESYSSAIAQVVFVM